MAKHHNMPPPYDCAVSRGYLAALLRREALRCSVPGAAIGVLSDGEATTAFHGVENVTTGHAVTPQTRFSVGSLTKSMVATLTARLADAGRLTFNDTVSAHVPELRGAEWAKRATLRDLLANRSGLPLSADLEFGFTGRGGDDGALARLTADVIGSQPAANFWSYTNVGWCVLGRVIERATGTSWENAMRRHLFDEAGMLETSFATDRVPVRRVSGHDVTARGAVPVGPLVARAYGPAGTNIVSTVDDLLRFAALHLEDSSLGSLREVHADVSIHAWLDAWCLGWAWFDWDGCHVWGWDGLISGERSVLRIVPEHQVAVVLMTNGNVGRAMYRSLFAELLESWFGISVPPLRLVASAGAAGDLSRFAGVYAWPDRRVEVTAAGNYLQIKSNSGTTRAFPLDEQTFLVDPVDRDNPTVTFGAFDAVGRPRVLYVMLWGLPRLSE